ncbi:DUF6371 domain-containing protein [Meridianimaribacter flavus]|uniref:Uncharacterized protein n=1 Tax=Meridianimaribacter flavus TaxID=571115 RepID=A0ABY2G8M9_9FLAO|nr:DUF6371 domain-containing protein [Meridianimaribacter flavus]TDY14147.1 hypothetical protein A8975_0749 [Meridianimaribacter flavus]
MNYKYSLDNSSRKFNCPKCQKKTFVRYLDNETGSYLNYNIGRCDRESKCQYHLKPNGNTTLSKLISIIECQNPTVLHFDNVLQSIKGTVRNNNLIKFLLQYFTYSEVRKAILEYNIGMSDHWKGATIFWQMDHHLNLYSGKIMLYDPISGKRVKHPYPHINWVHKVYGISNFVLRQCLFGIHNLYTRDLQTIVCIVESEKTAIIMSLIFPKYLWLATGSKSNFKLSLLEPLFNHNIVVYPDKSEYEDWHKKTQIFKTKGFKIKCSNYLEGLAQQEGIDLADIFV